MMLHVGEYIEQETHIGLTIIGLILLCLWMYIVGTLSIAIVMILALIIFNKVIEIVMNVSIVVQRSKIRILKM